MFLSICNLPKFWFGFNWIGLVLQTNCIEVLSRFPIKVVRWAQVWAFYCLKNWRHMPFVTMRSDWDLKPEMLTAIRLIKVIIMSLGWEYHEILICILLLVSAYIFNSACSISRWYIIGNGRSANTDGLGSSLRWWLGRQRSPRCVQTNGICVRHGIKSVSVGSHQNQFNVKDYEQLWLQWKRGKHTELHIPKSNVEMSALLASICDMLWCQKKPG